MTSPGEAANQTASLRYRCGALILTARLTEQHVPVHASPLRWKRVVLAKKHDCFLFALCSRVWAGSRRAKLLPGCSEQRVSKGEDPGQSFTTRMYSEKTLVSVSLGSRLSSTQTQTHDRFPSPCFCAHFAVAH